MLSNKSILKTKWLRVYSFGKMLKREALLESTVCHVSPKNQHLEKKGIASYLVQH